MKHIIFVFLIVFANSISAQKHVIGIKGGLSLTNIAANFNFGLKPENLKGFHAGITYDYLLNDRFYIGADLLYAQRGFTFNATLTNDVGNTIGYSYIDYNYQYFSTPLKVGYRSQGKFYVFGQWAVVPSILQHAEIHASEVNAGDVFLPDSRENMTSNVTAFDFAVNSELGIGWKLNRNFASYISASYQRSFTESKNNDFYQGVDGFHYGWMFSMGVKYAFSNKSE